jgi:large repetitive protein
VQTSANPAPSYSETGKLPAGVSLTSAGEIFVNPAAGTGGRYPITISASNGVGTPSTQSFVLSVTQAPAFTSAAKTTCKPRHQCQFTVVTAGYPVAAITKTGRLPNGLKLVAGSDGKATIEGKAVKAAAGRTFHLTFTAANSIGKAQQPFTLRVS